MTRDPRKPDVGGPDDPPTRPYPAGKARQADIILDTRRKQVRYAIVVGGCVIAVLLILLLAA